MVCGTRDAQRRVGGHDALFDLHSRSIFAYNSVYLCVFATLLLCLWLKSFFLSIFMPLFRTIVCLRAYTHTHILFFSGSLCNKLHSIFARVRCASAYVVRAKVGTRINESEHRSSRVWPNTHRHIHRVHHSCSTQDKTSFTSFIFARHIHSHTVAQMPNRAAHNSEEKKLIKSK